MGIPEGLPQPVGRVTLLRMTDLPSPPKEPFADRLIEQLVEEVLSGTPLIDGLATVMQQGVREEWETLFSKENYYSFLFEFLNIPNVGFAIYPNPAVYRDMDCSERTRDLILQLLSSRRDLWDGFVTSANLREMKLAWYDLAQWLDQRGYLLEMEGYTFWARVRLRLFVWLGI